MTPNGIDTSIEKIIEAIASSNNDPHDGQHQQQTPQDEREHLSSIACKYRTSRKRKGGSYEPPVGFLKGKIELNDLTYILQQACQTHRSIQFNRLESSAVGFVHEPDKLRSIS